jgi:hypothetical protein
LTLNEFIKGSRIKLFLDMDGVFCDFDQRVAELSGKAYKEVQGNDVWKYVNRDKEFFLNLPWIPGSKELWEACKQHNPTMLTGLPNGKGQPEHKRQWVAREMSPDIPVIVCPRREKVLQCEGVHSVLIDDHPENIAMWRAAGGTGILHTPFAYEKTISLLNLAALVSK